MTKIALMLLVLGLFGFLIGYATNAGTWYEYKVTNYKIN